jgi:hypothetical protein
VIFFIIDGNNQSEYWGKQREWLLSLWIGNQRVATLVVDRKPRNWWIGNQEIGG